MNIEKFAEDYEKEYKRLCRQRKTIFILWVICLVACVWFITTKHVNLWVLILIIYAIAFISFVGIDIKMQKNAARISQKFMDDFDVDFAYHTYQKILQKEKRKDYGSVMMFYLPFLLSIYRYEEFTKVFYQYSEKCKKKNPAYLKMLKESILGISRNREAHEKQVSGYTFSKYRDVEGNLTGYKANLRRRDKSREIEQLYLNKEYEKVIEKLQDEVGENKLAQIGNNLRIQKCLYHLGRKDEIIIPDAPEEMLLGFRQFLETGEGIYLENAEEIVEKIDEEIKKVERKNKISWGIVVVALIALYFAIGNLAAEEVAKGYGKNTFRYNLETHDFQYTEILNLVIENDDLIAGVVYGKPLEEDIEQLYLVGFNYKRRNFHDEVEMEIVQIGNAVEEERYYTFSGDECTYVMYIRESSDVMNYDGEWILDKNDSWFTGEEEQRLSAFVINGPFDPNKLDVEDEKIEEMESFEEEYKIGEYVYDGSDFTMYYFLNENLGWELRVIDSASGNRWYKLVQTKDGGQTWNDMNQDPYDGIGGTADGLKFYDENYGYISIACFSSTVSHIYMTEDGGESFWEMVMPTGECRDVENILDYQYAQMPEGDGDNVRIVVKRYRLDEEPGLVFESEDRGRNWAYVGREE